MMSGKIEETDCSILTWFGTEIDYFFLVYLSLVSSFSFVQMQSLSLKKEEKGRLRRTRNYKVSEGSEDSYDARAKDLMNKENKHW